MTVRELRDAIPYNSELQIYIVQEVSQSVEDAFYVGPFDKHPEVAKCSVVRATPVNSTLVRVIALHQNVIDEPKQDIDKILERLDKLEADIRELKQLPHCYEDAMKGRYY